MHALGSPRSGAHAAALEEHVGKHADIVAAGGGVALVGMAVAHGVMAGVGHKVAAIGFGVSSLVWLAAAGLLLRRLWAPRRANLFFGLIGLLPVVSAVVGGVVAGRLGDSAPTVVPILSVAVIGWAALLLSWRWLAFVYGVTGAGLLFVLAATGIAAPVDAIIAGTMFTGGVVLHGARMQAVGAMQLARLAHEGSQRAARIGNMEHDIAAGRTYWSPMLRELLELPADTDAPTVSALVGLVVPEQRARAWRAATQLIAEGVACDETLLFALPSGARPWYRVRAQQYADKAGRPTHYTATVLDESTRVEAERAAEESRTQSARHERLAAVGTLAGGVAHEINNPLMYAACALEIVKSDIEGALARPDLSAPARDALEQAAKEVGVVAKGHARIEFIARAIQRATQADAGSATETDVTLLARNAIARVASSLPPGVRVQDRLEAGQRARARAPEMEDVVTNLLMNAIDAIREAGRGSVIELATRDEGTDVVLTVSDDGPGVDPLLQGRLFTPFFTTRSTSDRSGLSLSIGLRLARDQGGDLTFAPRPGGGAMFRLRLPAWRPALTGTVQSWTPVARGANGDGQAAAREQAGQGRTP